MNITSDHWLEGAVRAPIAGGNAMNVRRFLVHHFTAGASAQSSIAWWRNPAAQGASAHLVIDRDGTIYQCRPFNRTCGHAGVSAWTDPKTKVEYTGLNACSIGIEIANGGDTYPTKFSALPPTRAKHRIGGKEKEWETYTVDQIMVVEAISKALVKRYNLDDLIGHEDCAYRMLNGKRVYDRKNDPGPAWPLQRMREACGFKGMPTRA